MLPENKKREVSINMAPDLWIYGNSYTGKTVFVNSFDNVLMLNTDGNVDHINSPILRIKDQITQQGRLTIRKYAWLNFKEIVTELEKKENTYETIAVDLLEDLYEHCRVYMYDKLKIEHESDAQFGKGYDMVKTEFLSTLKRLKNIGYQVVFISKEVKQELRKAGVPQTWFRPNLPEKIINVIEGMVDITTRVTAEGTKRYLNFKASETTTGGGRYNFRVDKVELNKTAFLELIKNTKI